MDVDVRTSSVLLGVGSVLFLVAAFLPVSRVYAEPDPEKKLEIILELKWMWNLSSVLFGIGSLVVVFGWALFVFSFNELSKVIIPLASIILLGTGALLWTWHVTERIIHPVGFVNGTNTPHLFLVYSLLTQVGLALAGWFLLRMPVPDWPGWMLIFGSAILFILMLVFKDMPPFVYYLLTLVLAITLFSQNG